MQLLYGEAKVTLIIKKDGVLCEQRRPGHVDDMQAFLVKEEKQVVQSRLEQGRCVTLECNSPSEKSIFLPTNRSFQFNKKRVSFD